MKARNIISTIIEILLLTFIILILGTFSFKISNRAHYELILKKISFEEQKTLSNESVNLHIEKGLQYTTEHIQEIESSLQRLPIAMFETTPKQIYLLSDQSFKDIFGESSAGVTFGGENIAISGRILTKSKNEPSRYLNFLEDVIYHESGHAYAYNRKNYIEYITDLIIPYPGPITHLSDYLKITEWNGERYFNTKYPITIDTQLQSEYGKTRLFEDYAESVRFVLNGQSHLISKERREFIVKELSISLEQQNRFIYPHPKLVPLHITEPSENILMPQRKYLATYTYVMSKEELEDYLTNLENNLKARSFFITLINNNYIKAETNTQTYFIQIPRISKMKEGEKAFLVIESGSDRTKLFPYPFEN